MRTILILSLFFLFQGQNNLKKYTNEEYGFSVSLPSIKESQKQSIDAGFANISRIRIVADTQQVSGIVKYNVTYRIIGEIFMPIGKTDTSAFYKEIKNGVIQMQESSCAGSIKIINKNIEIKNNATEVTYKLEYSDLPLVEVRKLIIKKNKSFCISYLTRPEYFNEKEKNDFITSFQTE
ncbi:MAG: hypothetical protein AB7P01_18525 [Bacteroidia bacterium]